MLLLTVIISIMLSLFSTAVMSYIAMATPIGPWIAPTLVLIALLLFRLYTRHASQAVVLVTVAGSIGGILATGVGFSFPTLYFLNPKLFCEWMGKPVYFMSIVSGLAGAAGVFGLLLANFFEYKVQEQDKLPFPISVLIHKMVVAGDQLRKAYELMAGFFATLIFCVLQDGVGAWRAILPKTVSILPTMVLGGIRIPSIGFDIWPMLWAIGFITGHVIAVPLAVGAVSRIALVDPLNAIGFNHISSVEFTFAFCSGMVLLGVIESLLRVPRMMRQFYAWLQGVRAQKGDNLRSYIGSINLTEQMVLCGLAGITLLCMGFSGVHVLYLLLFTAIFSYQMVVIAGKWGIAPLGRFATFVMLPAMVFFSVDIVHIVYIATFVEVCGGVAVDILFGRAVAKKSGLDMALVKKYQYLGLLVSVMSIGFVCWILINACPLGSAQLFAYKAQSRQLLINALMNGKEISWLILGVGALFSFVLAQCGLNAMLVMGGLLMPLNLSIGLIFGGMLTLLVRDRSEWEPFWSGVFAANSMWMLVRAII